MILPILMVVAGTTMYACGELYNKVLKYLMGIPIAMIAVVFFKSLSPAWCILTYLIACEFGYGDNNPLTHLLGKRGAITFCGVALGLASFPITGLYCLLGGVISGVSFYGLAVLDDKDILKEPFIGIFRGLAGSILLLIA